MGLCLGLWSLSQDRRPAIDSPQAVWEVRPTRLHNSFFPPLLTPVRFLFRQSLPVVSRSGKCLMAGVHRVTLGGVEPEPGYVARR